MLGVLVGLTGCLGIEVEGLVPPTANTVQEPYPRADGTTEATSAGAQVTTPDAEPTPKVTGTLAPYGKDPVDVLAQVTSKLDQAKSLHFTVKLDHTVTIDVKDQTFTYTGRGGADDSGRFASILRGPADVFFYVEADGRSVSCQDSRGKVDDCSPIDGGPLRAVSLYALIAYLRHVDSAEAMPSPDGEANKMIYRYKPSLDAISRIDQRHQLTMEQVETVEGTVSIEATNGLPTSQSLELLLKTTVGLERVSATMQFENFGEPFDAESLRLMGR